MSEILLLGALLVVTAVAIVLAVLAARWHKDAVELGKERGAREALAAEAGQLRGRLSAIEQELQTSNKTRIDLSAQLTAERLDHVKAAAQIEHMQAAQEKMERFINEAQTKLTDAFTLQAAKVLDEKGQRFEKDVRQANQQGRADLDTLLKPFADNLGKFQTQVSAFYGDEAKERASLKGAVQELKTLNQDMATKAEALTKALRGNAKIRGDWGELMLESVLRGSGLEEGVHYERQQSSTDEEGRRLRPDVVVSLPDDHLVVVDSKVNLLAWQDAMNAVDEPEAHSLSLQRHSDALRKHVRDLADRNYPRAFGDRALEITIAFVPIEGALSAALGTDPSLQNFAFERGVLFASPNTLMAMLRVVDRLWTRDTMQRRVLEIGESADRLLDALSQFLDEFDSVGKGIREAEKKFDAARNRLSESRQGVIPRARRLVDLGIKGKKQLHANLKSDSALPSSADTE